MSPEYEAGFDVSGRLLAEERSGDNAPPLSVSELSAVLKRTVEDRFGHVRIRGEISGFKRAASGHLYLCLKDDSAVLLRIAETYSMMGEDSDAEHFEKLARSLGAGPSSAAPQTSPAA
uniref:exodeoxyribonuclease VII large subunit n=1 Tax=Sphingobium sp. TaxID=1912891 RepID=UPI0035C6A1EC